MPTPTASTDRGPGRRSKVRRLLDEYDLEDLGGTLEAKWTAEENRSSLRDLADFFNRRFLEATLRDAGLQPVAGEVETMYRVLTGADAPGGDEPRIRRRLERNGIDVDGVLADFVSYQAIRTYLTKYREAEYEPEPGDPIDQETTTIQKLQGRLSAVTERSVDRFRDKERLNIGEFRVLVNVEILCEDCNRTYAVSNLLERGTCECDLEE
jgi:hypothetical protein